MRTIFITSLTALTFWFRLLLVLLWLPILVSWGVVHEALDHIGPNQSKPTECPLFHYEQRQRRVEVGLLWQLLSAPDTEKQEGGCYS